LTSAVLAGLHEHDEYSLLDGAGTAQQHAEAAVEAGYVALAETNHATLAGSLHHMRACREAGILPISGVEMYWRPNRKVQGQKEWLKRYSHITLLADGERGWRSMMRLVSQSHRDGFYGRACCDPDLMERNSEGMICLTGCLGGNLAQRIVAEDDRGAEASLRELIRIYGVDRVIVELMPHDIHEQRIVNVEKVRLANKYGLMVVTTVDGHYPRQEWAGTQDVLLMIATNQTVAKREAKREAGEDVYKFDVQTLYHLTVAEIMELYIRHHPDLSYDVVSQSISNTLQVAAMCRPFLVDKTEKMPVVSFPGEPDNVAFLRRLTYEGLERRGYKDDPVYRERVDFEMDTFVKLGAVEQMLMAWDVVDWAKSDRPIPTRDKKTGELVFEGKKKPIMVGPGRGSAAGCAVSWATRITNVNPIKHRLLFERFLNPSRQGKPDIDIDFPPERVDEVEAYVKVVHGVDRVVDIVAHSTFGPRAALSDVGRVLGVPYAHVKAATKTIDDKAEGSLEDIRLLNPAVDKLASENPEMWSHACRIKDGVARKSEHAGGLLILPGPAEEFIPVERKGGQKGKLLSAFGERSGKGNALISDYGFNKLDVLRVAELTKQQLAVDLHEERTGVRIVMDDLEVHDDPYATDPEVMQGFKDGLLVGIFQFSATAQKLTRQVKPDSIFDLAAINALIRPGARGSGADQTYARRKNGEEETTYWHPILQPILGFTHGVVAFQESLMEVVHKLGGLSLTDADNFRKIVSKEYRDPVRSRKIMAEWAPRVKNGFAANGLNAQECEIVWTNTCESFSAYAFNLSHADGYSILAYRDMWQKIHITREFYAALLSKGLSKVTKKRVSQKAEAVREARHRGLRILPPDVNVSGRDYTVVDEGIRLGLEAIKHIGPAASAAIEKYRPFESYEDMEARVPPRHLNVTSRAALVMAGACDRWKRRDRFTEERIDEMERELLGMSLTSVHSIAAFADVIEGRFWTEDEFDAAEEGQRVTVVGEVVAVKDHVDKNGNIMCFVDLAYGPNRWSLTVFASLYEDYGELLHSKRPILATGSKSTHKGRSSIKVESLPHVDSSEFVAPIMDLEMFVEMVGGVADDAEMDAMDSVFPEDLGMETDEPVTI
jgi:DNA polymerase-3 subunit alpha